MKRQFPLFLLLACAAVFVFGLVRLFELRFEVGDVYPPYSSLRTDPLGTMAFYESLGRIPGFSARRDFSTQNRLPDEPHTVYLHLAAATYDWDSVPADLSRELDAFLARGNRLVITFFPQTSPYAFRPYEDDDTNSLKSAHPRSRSERMAPRKSARKKADDEEHDVDLNEQWGFALNFVKEAQNGDVYKPVQVESRTDLELPLILQWHSGNVFTKLDSAWRVIYARDADPVVIERRFGKGSVVMATDSYFVSNEAMARDRHADLLAWLVGGSKKAVFDEAHFGIAESPGIAMLMRKYRLDGLVAGLLLLAGLFIWENTVTLIPRRAQHPPQTDIVGKDSGTGFTNLLRRNIPPRDLLPICFAEWKKSAGPAAHHSGTRWQQAEATFRSDDSLPPGQRNPVATYKTLCSLLGTRNPPPKS